MDILIDISKRIATGLKTKLTTEELELIEKLPTENIDAYNLYNKGRYFYNKKNVKGHKDAIDYFNEAIDIDPNFALAYVGLADSYSSLSLISRLAFKNHFIKTKDAALSALKIDSNLAEAHTSLGFVKLWYEWDWTGAANDFKRAIQLNPNYAEAHHNYADCLVTF